MGCVGSAMVNPISGMGERNIAIRYQEGPAGRHQLHRFPHIFSHVLELPFTADANVVVEEGPTDFRFVAQVRAHVIQIAPDVIKIVILGELDSNLRSGLSCADGSRWRFRLPDCTQPTLATANYVDGELVVTYCAQE